MSQETFDPQDEAERSIDIAVRYREKSNDKAAWFALAFSALRIFALLASSYLKRDR